MSFKRDGDDRNLLSLLQKRRIKDLLAEDIPEEEAKLLSNGRLACLVCMHHPIFDTIAMLCVHRDGKKHKSYAQIFERKKQELKQLILNRQQEQFSKSVSTTIPAASSRHNSLSFSSPYDSRVHKHKVKKRGRKLQVDLHGDSDSHSAVSSSLHDIRSETTCETTSAGAHTSSSLWHQTAEQQLHGPIKHGYKLKNIFKEKCNAPVHISPYVSKSHQNNSNSRTISSGDVLQTGYFKSDASYSSPSCQTHQNYTFDVPKHPNPNQLFHVPSSSEPEQIPFSLSPASTPNGPKSSSQDGRFIQVHESKKSKRKKETQGSSNSLRDAKSRASCPTLAEKFYQLQGSGWKRDWDGKWIKDEQAEFDSDEEPPDIPLLF